MLKNKGMPLAQQPWKGPCWVSYSWEHNGQQFKWLHSEIPHSLWSNQLPIAASSWTELSLQDVEGHWWEDFGGRTPCQPYWNYGTTVLHLIPSFLLPLTLPSLLPSLRGQTCLLVWRCFQSFSDSRPMFPHGFFSINLISSNPTTVPVMRTTVSYTLGLHTKENQSTSIL